MSADHIFTAAPGASGRLDRWLAQQMPALSRSRIKALIEAGQVRVGGATVLDPSRTVKPGDRVDLTVPEPADALPKAEALPLDIVFEDDALIVVDKPAGLVVHPAPGAWTGTLVNALLHHCGDSLSGIGGVRRPGIVHRIDKDTSGLLVVAKTDAAHHGLAEQFAAHAVERRYTAFVRGHPQPKAGRITGNIGRHSVNRKKMAVVKSGGKPAVTHYATAGPFWGPKGEPAAAELQCRLETGRTHQVRVHMAEAGHPLLGDPLYARPWRLPVQADAGARGVVTALSRQALHAQTLGFEHPLTGTFLKFSSPLPYDLQELKRALERLGGWPR